MARTETALMAENWIWLAVVQIECTMNEFQASLRIARNQDSSKFEKFNGFGNVDLSMEDLLP